VVLAASIVALDGYAASIVALDGYAAEWNSILKGNYAEVHWGNFHFSSVELWQSGGDVIKLGAIQSIDKYQHSIRY
jgi:hypothetical protein